MNRLLTAAGAVLALAAPATAHAAEPVTLRLTNHAVKVERIAYAIDAARTYWGALPDCGPAGIAWRTLRSDYGIVGYTTGPCNVHLATDLLKYGTRRDVCVTVVHEIGHALGRVEHTEHPTDGDPVNVMADGFTVAPGVPAPCSRRALRATRR